MIGHIFGEILLFFLETFLFYTGEIVLFILTFGKKKPRWKYYTDKSASKFIIFTQISLWIGPVPISGQTFAVLLSGAILGSRLGALSQLSYLVVGITGIPFWFSLGGAPGIARLTGPTGGYLVGFVACAFIVGWLVEKGWGKNVWKAAVAMIGGSSVIYIFGLSWLSFYVPSASLLKAGFYPFIIGDVAKIILAAMILPIGCTLLRRIKS